MEQVKLRDMAVLSELEDGTRMTGIVQDLYKAQVRDYPSLNAIVFEGLRIVDGGFIMEHGTREIGEGELVILEVTGRCPCGADSCSSVLAREVTGDD